MKVNERRNAVDDAVKIITDRKAIDAAKERILQEGTQASDRAETDTVNVGLASAIAKAFDPATLEVERKARVEEVKRRLAAGIVPSGEELAQSISDGVSELRAIVGKNNDSAE